MSRYRIVKQTTISGTGETEERYMLQRRWLFMWWRVPVLEHNYNFVCGTYYYTWDHTYYLFNTREQCETLQYALEEFPNEAYKGYRLEVHFQVEHSSIKIWHSTRWYEWNNRKELFLTSDTRHGLKKQIDMRDTKTITEVIK